MLKKLKFKILSILFSLVLTFSLLPISSANAKILTLPETTTINSPKNLDNINVKNLNTQSESTIFKSQSNINLNARSLVTEGSTDAYIPKELKTSIAPRSIIGTDERSKITNTTSFPYSAICFIQIEFPSGAMAAGTAWMYGKDVAITAGHCLYDAEEGGWATSIIVVPGMNGGNMPLGYAYATSISAPEGWTGYNKTDYDWGVIELNSNIGDKTGYFGAHWSLLSLKGSNVDITGYPGEKEGNEAMTLWKMNGNVTDSSSNKIFYNIDSTGGQSGCPVYWKDSEGTRAIGIHTNGNGNIAGKPNSGTRITKSMFDYMNTFR